LPSPDVRPLQCLVTLAADSATITRWAAGVKLNGQEFSKAELTDGDRLTIGEWELEFEHSEAASEEQSAALDEQELSVESTLDSLQALTLEDALEWDEPPITTPEAFPETVISTTPIVEWPSDFEVVTVEEVPPTDADEWPIVEEARPVDAAPAAPATCLSSHAFADSLVLQLWSANDRARRRAKQLITGLRAARFQADALAADLSAIETELDLARAAYDSHLGNDERLQQELAKQHEERVTPLLEQIASLQVELERAQADISQQTAAYESLAGEFSALQTAAQTATVDPALATRAEEIEAAALAQSQELERITGELELARQEHERLAEQVRQAADRCTQESARAAAEGERAEGLEAAVAAHAQEIEELTGELRLAQQEQQRLAELHQAEAIRAAQFAKALLDQQALIEAAALEAQTPETPVEFAETIAEPAPVSTDPWRDAMQAPQELAPEPTPAPAEAPPAIEYSTPSFIDKYRHLLETDESPELLLAPKGSQPVIDDEFLSPAKAEPRLGPADESDDALEAYMANMMRRMRTTSPSYESSQSAAALDALMPASGSLSTPVEPAAPVAFVPEEPFNIEDMKNSTRKTPLASDLAALREMANNSARTAIATHNHKQVRQSAVTKFVIALTAAATSAYIMNSAPALDAWQFWGGAVTGVLGIGAAVQALIIERRSRVRAR
jgi:hypothetical protein